ncbi:hypothetical protein PBY51_010106 [Eleginops maclovinus]|uniref:SERTA domain-containing protein n=1 Tax=Eleginops maclovinus TaxID=56733 RepID=A0AAN7XYA6_ELEMC|nr:hypothetical protein PBY51_010106 [Eleginops maclovinus]
MIMKGQKRKHPPEEVDVSDRSSPMWESQRQFVFSVSLNKYHHSQGLPEPSLRRSVLIANTLRQVSLEAFAAPSVDMEASPPPCSSSSGLLESVFTAKHHPAETFSNSHSALDEDEDWGSISTDSDFSLSAVISSILTALDSTIDGSSQAAPRTPLRSLENLPAPTDGGVGWVKQGFRGYGGGWEQQEEGRARESSTELMRCSYLSELTVEDLFQDIDSSLLEMDMGVLGLLGSGGGCPTGDDLLRYLPPFSSSPSHPFSLSLNQNLKCLPSLSSFGPLSSSSSSPTCLSSPPFSSQNHGLDLEHLMEILVES